MLSSNPKTASAILSQFLWFNSQILINSESIFFRTFADNKLFSVNGNLKGWNLLKEEFCLNDKHKIQWIQIVNSLPKQWKETIKQDKGESNNLIIQDHHLIKNYQERLNKLESKEVSPYKYLCFL